MDKRKNDRPSPKRSKKSTRSIRREQQSGGRQSSSTATNSNREHRIIRKPRTQKTACCRNAERCKGIGAVLFTLGIPTSIAGVILTVVAATDDGKENKYPESFIAVGPILLVIAVILFSLGLCLYNPHVWDFFQRCFSLDDPNSCCRVHCKKLSHCLKPDDAIIINQAAMKALQAEPGKPVLKRGKLPSVTSEGEGRSENAWTLDETRINSRSQHVSKGVRFSDSDADDRDNHSNSPDSASVLSLRHCKVYPKSEPENIWWTDDASTNEKESDKEPKDMTMTTEL